MTKMPLTDKKNFYPRPPRGGRLDVGHHAVVGVQISIHALREEGDFGSEPAVTVKEGNLWEFLPFEDRASLVLSVLSMQFMPTAYRRFMLRQICESIVDGGALIYVEKVVAGSLDDLMVDLYYQMKRENGYTDEQIMAKRRSLENVLSPLEPEWNEALLKEAGFRRVQMFWRCLNFCGWIAVK